MKTEEIWRKINKISGVVSCEVAGVLYTDNAATQFSSSVQGVSRTSKVYLPFTLLYTRHTHTHTPLQCNVIYWYNIFYLPYKLYSTISITARYLLSSLQLNLLFWASHTCYKMASSIVMSDIILQSSSSNSSVGNSSKQRVVDLLKQRW